MSTRNQISGSITFDVASLADAIAARLQQPAAGPASVPSDIAEVVIKAHLPVGVNDRAQVAAHLVSWLAEFGYTLVRHPRETPAAPAAPTTERDWFSRRNDS